ncbi:hypothetical protein ABDJ41_06860 [Pedobacter sp. ASV1-7]|uniref:hypothetical protein n=1 Tax=Pedobacter sp. ASV1-7 TaxID=3145237 RepID=UPI0032E89935
MKRRSFLLLVGVGTGSIAVPASLYFLSPAINEHAVLLIKRELYYLKLEEGSVEKYVADYFRSAHNNLLAKLKWKAMYYMQIKPDQSAIFFELVKYYLLSTDFFINKADESKVVRYLGLYNPYKSPVPNPFSFTLYPPDTVKDV